MLEPDQDQLEQFCDALLRHRGTGGYVSLRTFLEGADKVFRITPVALRGGFPFLIDAALDDARRAAQNPRPAVFCPPIASFQNPVHAREQDLLAGFALSVECDQHPQQARTTLEQLLGPATVVVTSGGVWVNGGGAPEDKLHLHWRLAKPAQGKDDLAKLKRARGLAAGLVDGDPSNAPVTHPIRWPGSWHRKAEPRLCAIETLNPDVEIDLDAALTALEAAAPQPQATAGNAAGQQAPPADDWDRLVSDIVTGKSYHEPLVKLAARLVGSGAHDGTTVKMLRSIMAASTAPRDQRWQSRFDSIPRIVTSARDKFDHQSATAAPVSGKPLLWPFQARPFIDIPRRHWLHAGHYVSSQVVMTVAPGGYGKTSLIICNAIEMATGRGLLGPPPPCGPLRVGFWNAEDDDEEVERRIAAACLLHGVDPASLQGRLFLGSRLTGRRRMATADRNGNVAFDTAMLAEIEQLIKTVPLDCVILDPLIAFHRLAESDNAAMEQLVKDALGEIATRTGCCIELSQHTRKASQGRQGDLTADDSRGAGAIVNAARSVRVLNRMTAEEAELPKIAAEDRRLYLRVSHDKTNLAPPAKALWVRLVSVDLPNGDKVQAVEAWNYPQPFDDVTPDDMRWMRDEVTRNSYRADPRSPEWVGRPLAKRLDIDPDNPGDRKRLHAILAEWIAKGVLATEARPDAHRHPKLYMVPGEWEE